MDRLKEIEDAIHLMQKRFDEGQGALSSAMCRLSLPMAKELMAEVKRSREKLLEDIVRVESRIDAISEYIYEVHGEIVGQ